MNCSSLFSLLFNCLKSTSIEFSRSNLLKKTFSIPFFLSPLSSFDGRMREKREKKNLMATNRGKGRGHVQKRRNC